MSQDFRALLRQKGNELWRDMPWRTDTRPFYVLVSELMLQQTQVGRVIPKFESFIEQFPDEKALSTADLAEVLKVWQGLGYNRRAKFLYEAAKKIVDEFSGEFPRDEKDIMSLPGVGKNTAGAIQAYAFNYPSIFVETNIRTVYIHHFFADDFAVSDTQIIEKLGHTIDRENPRRFYQNLMDYGTFLKQSGVKNNYRSKHYKKQSPLKGSLREMRGEIVRRLAKKNSLDELMTDTRYAPALDGLSQDGLITYDRGAWQLTK